MKVLLTGATGFVGNAITQALVSRDVSIRAIVRGMRTHPPGITEHVHTDDMFEEDAAFYSRALDGVDAVIHAAWFVEHGAYVTSSKNLSALVGTLRFGQAAIEAGVKRFVGLGTCFEYDLTAPMPLTSASTLAPNTPYGAAKAAAYMALSRAFAHAELSFAWARLFYLHGEGEDPRRFVASIKAQLSVGGPAKMSSGRQVRDYMHVADAGRRIAALCFDHTEGAVNICSGQPQSLAELALSIAAPLGQEHLLAIGSLPDRPGDPAVITGIPYVPLEETTNDANHA